MEVVISSGSHTLDHGSLRVGNYYPTLNFLL